MEIVTMVLAFLSGPVVGFFGGATFRMVWGELSSWWTKRQDHAQEQDRIRLQDQMAANQHEREQEAIKTQHALGVEVIRLQSAAKVDEIVVSAWGKLVESTTKATGFKVIDFLNGIIRPGCAVWGLAMLTFDEFHPTISLSETTLSIAGAALGIYLADRTLIKRGK